MSRYRYTPEDRRALAWCNRIRAKLGKKPVRYIRKGVRYEGCDCPLAKTIGHVRVTYPFVLNLDPYRTITETPKYIQRWLSKFDTIKLPHFIAKGDSRV